MDWNGNRLAGPRSVRRWIVLPFMACLLAMSASQAVAQMLGPRMAQLAGPFAGRTNATGREMLPLYGSEAGAFPHLLQGTEVLVPIAQGGSSAPDGLRMASSSDLGTAAGRRGGAAPDRQVAAADEKPERPEAPEVGELSDSVWEVLVGSCAGGAFIGAFSAVNAAPVAVAGVAAPVAAIAVASAAAVGCGLGVATAGVSLTTVFGWRRAFR
jgi:hypothetical protein